MNIPDTYDTPDIIDEIECVGMLYTLYRWIPITCTILVDRETEKAVHGMVRVVDVDDTTIYEPQIYWVPKSMSQNPWFICTKLYDEERKVANKRFENYSNNNSDNYTSNNSSQYGHKWDNNYG